MWNQADSPPERPVAQREQRGGRGEESHGQGAQRSGGSGQSTGCFLPQGHSVTGLQDVAGSRSAPCPGCEPVWCLHAGARAPRPSRVGSKAETHQGASWVTRDPSPQLRAMEAQGTGQGCTSMVSPGLSAPRPWPFTLCHPGTTATQRQSAMLAVCPATHVRLRWLRQTLTLGCDGDMARAGTGGPGYGRVWDSHGPQLSLGPSQQLSEGESTGSRLGPPYGDR